MFYWITFINGCICILNGSTGSYLFIIVYIILKIGGNENSPYSINVILKLTLPRWKQGNYPVIPIYGYEEYSDIPRIIFN